MDAPIFPNIYPTSRLKGRDIKLDGMFAEDQEKKGRKKLLNEKKFMLVRVDLLNDLNKKEHMKYM